jgi:hypothetical protein
MRRIVITTGAVAVVLATALAGATPILADEPPDADLVIGYPPACDDPDAVSNSAVECDAVDPVDSLGPIAPEIQAAAEATARADTALVAAEGTEALRKNCRFHAEVSIYTDSDWNRLAQNLAAEASHCADYTISLPAIAGNKTQPRGDQAWRIRVNGPRFNKKTWVQAGEEFRKRMVTAGYDLSLGDTWALNEVPSAVRVGTGQARRNLLDFLRGLHDGDGSAPTKGLVFVVGFGQATQNLSVYLTNMRRWLADSAFWNEADGYVRFWAQEAYGDVRAWGVADAPRMTRAQHLIAYLMHPLILARAGGEQTADAEAFLRRTYVPLANAAWKWQSGFGFTDVDQLVMRHFVSEQVFAIRHDAGTHPAEGPEGRLGFAWAPEPRGESDFPAKTAALQQRLASALANAYAQGGGSQMGACGPPGDHVWCDGSYEGALFNDGWEVFSNPWT